MGQKLLGEDVVRQQQHHRHHYHDSVSCLSIAYDKKEKSQWILYKEYYRRQLV